MTLHRSTLVLSLAIVLTAINLLLLVFLISRVNTPELSNDSPLLRGSALELVDDHDQVRARLNVEQDGQVVLRLLDQVGTIRVKLGASTEGSGLVLLNDATQVGLQLLAEGSGSSLKLKNRDGNEQIISP